MDYMLVDMLQPAFWIAVGQIIWINVLLSGDNAVVIALACRSLPPKQRFWGILLGAGAAVLLLQHERAEAELRAFFKRLPRDSLFPIGLAIELQRARLDLVLGEFAREIAIRALLLAQSDVEHEGLPCD